MDEAWHEFTVKELIDHLSKFPPDAKVKEDHEYYPVRGVYAETINGDETVVYIWCD